MSILNKYIMRKFLRPFLASYAALTVVILVSQLFERLDRFLVDGVKWGHVAAYLLASLPFQSLQILPVACLLGTLFVVGDLARNREYIAGLAGGVAPERFLGGILIAGFCISLVALAINEAVVPPTVRYSNSVFREKIRKLGTWRQTVYRNVSVAGAEGRLWNIKKFEAESGEMSRVIVDTFQNGRLVSQIDASKANWKIDGWRFEDGVLRTFAPDNTTLGKMEAFKEKAYPFEERPADLLTLEPQSEEMNYNALKKHIRRLDSLGVPVRKLEVELLMKVAFPFACFIVTVLGVPLALRGRGNRAIGIAAAGLVALAYMGFLEVGKALAQRLIPPIAGAWLGNAVFLALGIAMWVRMRRKI